MPVSQLVFFAIWLAAALAGGAALCLFWHRLHADSVTGSRCAPNR
jgi:hypothetical protein